MPLPLHSLLLLPSQEIFRTDTSGFMFYALQLPPHGDEVLIPAQARLERVSFVMSAVISLPFPFLRDESTEADEDYPSHVPGFRAQPFPFFASVPYTGLFPLIHASGQLLLHDQIMPKLFRYQ